MIRADILPLLTQPSSSLTFSDQAAQNDSCNHVFSKIQKGSKIIHKHEQDQPIFNPKWSTSDWKFISSKGKRSESNFAISHLAIFPEVQSKWKSTCWRYQMHLFESFSCRESRCCAAALICCSLLCFTIKRCALSLARSLPPTRLTVRAEVSEWVTSGKIILISYNVSLGECISARKWQIYDDLEPLYGIISLMTSLSFF